MRPIDIHPSSIAIKTTLFGIAVSVILIFIKGIPVYLGHFYALITATESGVDILSSTFIKLI
jgi:divalent metal cation (Fe/Co/Zn/Cd) transporter